MTQGNVLPETCPDVQSSLIGWHRPHLLQVVDELVLVLDEESAQLLLADQRVPQVLRDLLCPGHCPLLSDLLKLLQARLRLILQLLDSAQGAKGEQTEGSGHHLAKPTALQLKKMNVS